MDRIKKPTIIKKLKIYDKLIDIFLNNEINKYVIVEDVLSKSKSISFVTDFLNKHDTECYKSFNNALNNEMIVFSSVFPDTFDIKTNKVYINYQSTIKDSFVLLHEFMHYFHNNKCINIESNPFREALSIMYENVFSDYLFNKTGLVDSKNQMIYRLQNNTELATSCRDYLEIYKKEENNEDLSEEQIDYLVLNSMFLRNCNLDSYSVYLLGSIFSSYIHQRILNKDLNIKDLNKIKNFIINEQYLYFSEILNLDFSFNENGFDISDESIKKLNRAYSSEVKYYEG